VNPPLNSRPGLERLLHPFSEEEFFGRHWPERPLVLHDRGNSLAELLEMPELQSADRIFEACRGTSVTALLPDRRDESNSAQVTPEVGAKLFAAGMNVSVGSAEKFFPPLRPWLDHLALDLGLPQGTWGRSIVYLSPPGTGAPPHFDMNANFSLQIKGRKVWTLFPNESVRHPTERLVMKLDEPSAMLRAEAHAPFPKEVPASAERIELRPGSLLFVPRGTWHATTADEETIALNFTFSQQSWAFVLAQALLERLHREEAWRKTPDLRATSAAGLAAEHADAEALLADLRRHVAEMAPPELLAAATPYRRRFRRKDGVHLRRNGTAVALDIAGKGRMPLEVPADYLPLLEAAFGGPDWFRLDDLVARSGAVRRTDIYILLERLVDAEVLETGDG
jgi:50S ribosomal protein L16 3-hydroxylase